MSGVDPKQRSLISIVVPVFNEADCVRPFLDALSGVMGPLEQLHRYEVIFVNDGSLDKTEEIIVDLIETNPEIKLVNLSRNFGKEAALSAGLDFATGDAVIPMDVDMQDPPGVIVEMIELWRGGAKVVNARRATRTQDNWARRVSAGAFYRLFNALAEDPIPSNVGDFRLLDKDVVEVIRKLGERTRFNKSLFSWVGFEPQEVVYDRPARAEGESRWNSWKLWKLALDGIFSSSTIPLRIWTYVGIFMAFAALCYSTFIVVRTISFGVDVPGYASTFILILMFGSLNSFALGIIGEYVGRIYNEVRRRPLYIVRSVKEANPGDL